MKKRRTVKLAALLAAACVAAGACGTGEKNGTGTETGSAGSTADDSAVSGAKNDADTGNGADTGNDAGSGSGSDAGGSTAQQGRSLDAQELDKFTAYVNEIDNYGFLLSVYEDPSELNLHEVFYSGAGIQTQQLNEAQKAAYLEAAETEEVYTDITCLHTDQLDAFLLKKTGLTYAQMKHPLEWVYLKDYDLYCMEHGDTNYCAFTCIAGSTADENTFTLRFRTDEEYNGNGIGSSYHDLDCEAVLVKQEDGYRFRSNRMVTEENRIDAQTFPITLPESGDAVFASYAPGEDQNPQSDVTFMVQYPDGRMLQTLTGSCENNLRAITECFDSVQAVSFPDYNGDGFMDLITITSYSYTQGPDAGSGFSEIRIYTGNQYGYFYYEKELSRYVSESVKEPTIEAVNSLLAEGSFYGTWRIAACAGTSGICAMSQDEIDSWTGRRLSFERDCYLWGKEEDAFYEETWVNGYSPEEITAEAFHEWYQTPLSALGIDADHILKIQTVEFGGTLVEPGFFLIDQNTLLVCRDGVFFTAVREE